MSNNRNSKFFEFRQNNSGGTFEPPAVCVLVEAESSEDACRKTNPHFSLCGNSGMYAEYDSCGCCPCCGHRWSEPWVEPQPESELIDSIKKNGLSYMGGVSTALIKADGLIIVGDSPERLESILEYIENSQ